MMSVKINIIFLNDIKYNKCEILRPNTSTQVLLLFDINMMLNLFSLET